MSSTQEQGRSISYVAATVATILVALVAVAVPGAAQQRSEVSVAVIDVGRILEDSEAGKAAVQQLLQLREEKNKEGTALQEQAQELQTRISEGTLSLSEEKLAELREEFEDKVQELRSFQEKANRDLQREQEKALKGIEERVMPVINQVGQEFGYTLIFNKFQSGLVFAKDEIDITDLVLERFNASEAGE